MGEEQQGADRSAEEALAASGYNPETQAAVDSVVNRRSRWISAMAALRYVSSVSRDDGIQVRDSDKSTTYALLVCCFAALLCLLVPAFEAQRIPFVVAADVLVGLALLMYVANRFGIVTTFQPRQALLTWQLMLGSSLLGIFMTINLALILAVMVQKMHFVIPR